MFDGSLNSFLDIYCIKAHGGLIFMKILVTGANGYLGQGIVKKLLNCGQNVIATDFDTCFVDERAKKINCDLFKVENPYHFFSNPDILLHLAWRDGFVHYSDAHIEDLPKHYSFINKIMCSPIKKIAVMGSMHEIGFFEGSIDSTTPCRPVTPYGVAKNALRDLVQLLSKQKNIEFQWLRGYYIVGNSNYGSSIFSKIASAAESRKSEFPFTEGQNQQDFIDYEDFCALVVAAVGQDEVNGIIEICSGKPTKLADRVERFIKENKFKIELKYGEFPDRPYDSKAIWGNNSKINYILERSKLFTK